GKIMNLKRDGDSKKSHHALGRRSAQTRVGHKEIRKRASVSVGRIAVVAIRRVTGIAIRRGVVAIVVIAAPVTGVSAHRADGRGGAVGPVAAAARTVVPAAVPSSRTEATIADAGLAQSVAVDATANAARAEAAADAAEMMESAEAAEM